MVDLYLKSAIEGVVIKWATQINDVLTEESSQAFAGGQNPTPNAGKSLHKCIYTLIGILYQLQLAKKITCH